MYYKRSRSDIKGQGQSVKTSSDRQIIAPSLEIAVAESNGDGRILIGSSQLAVCAHAQYIFRQKQRRSTDAPPGSFQVAMHAQLHARFLVHSVFSVSFEKDTSHDV